MMMLMSKNSCTTYAQIHYGSIERNQHISLMTVTIYCMLLLIVAAI